MKGDFSRDTFDPGKHYRGVLTQQGRVQMDADANEQQRIANHLARLTARDEIGPNGVPKPEYGGGFAIAIDGSGKDLTVSKGHLYVDGVLCENDTDTTLLTQPYFMKEPAPDKAGVYSVYLDVWERLVTAIEDPSIREKALGGPDTATRVQNIWQVCLARIGDPGSASTCATMPEVVPGGGAMAARVNSVTADPSPCVLPPQTGYRSLENQLYRVEIHQPGDLTNATFKWSRENGSVLTAITHAAGQTLDVQSVGRDENLGFAHDQWVEVLDDRIELTFQANALLQVDVVDAGKRKISLKQAPPAVDPGLHPRLRRWEQTGGDEVMHGVALAAGWLPLEEGVEVKFAGGIYSTGDYWLIPARTGISAETGSIEWPVDSANNPLSLPPRGIEHHLCRLAVVGFDGSKYQPIDGVVPDCRKAFPPLTDITAGDVSYDPAKCSNLAGATTVQAAIDLLCGGSGGPCTLVPKPGAGWQAELLALPAGSNADICFPIGDFPLDQPLTLQKLGHLRLSGGGPGTRFMARGSESAFIFDQCRSVEVWNIAAICGAVGTPRINGALTFTDCLEVTVDSCSLECGSGPGRAAACISVRNTITPGNRNTGAGSVRIRHCDLTVGESQDGILLVQVGRVQVEDNAIRMAAFLKTTLRTKLQNSVYRKQALSALISTARYAVRRNPTAPLPMPTRPPGNEMPHPAVESGKDASGDVLVQQPVTALDAKGKSAGNVSLTAGNYTVHFQTHPALRDFWPVYLRENGPKEVSAPRDLLSFVQKTANQMLVDASFRDRFAAVAEAIASLDQAAQGPMSRGIAVAGEGVRECRLLNNSIAGALQGITVGMSNHKNSPHTADFSSSVTISGNHIDISLPGGANRMARHAIFVGNVTSLLIENNFAQLDSNIGQVFAEAIRVWGQLGGRMIIRHNHLIGFDLGILIHPLNTVRSAPLWLASENFAASASRAVSAPDNVIQANNIP